MRHTCYVLTLFILYEEHVIFSLISYRLYITFLGVIWTLVPADSIFYENVQMNSITQIAHKGG
jgi:hypothetical protein